MQALNKSDAQQASKHGMISAMGSSLHSEGENEGVREHEKQSKQIQRNSRGSRASS
jgi:hypothetical protein